ncbi:MAG: cupin domain-containing protein [Halobacteriota archaeon]
MGYQLIDLDDIEPLPNRPSKVIEISNHYVPPDNMNDSDIETQDRTGRGPEHIGLRLYTVAPGEQTGHRYHYHDQQEEVFYVLEGTLHVETPEREYRVEAGHVFVVEPGSPQRAFNPETNDEAVRMIAIGAPSYTVMGGNDGHEYVPDAE